METRKQLFKEEAEPHTYLLTLTQQTKKQKKHVYLPTSKYEILRHYKRQSIQLIKKENVVSLLQVTLLA